MKVKVIENKMLIESGITIDDFDKVRRYAPEALVIVNEETKDEIFKVTRSGKSNITDYAAIFERSGDKLVAWLDVCGKPDDMKEYIEEVYGMTLARIREVEVAVNHALKSVKDKIKTIEDSIEIVGEDGEDAPRE